jgi:hypothetical protein
MEVSSKICNGCGRTKGETNNWVKAYTSPLSHAILFATAEEVIDPNGYIVEDFCGQGCASRRWSNWFNQWMNPQPPPSESTLVLMPPLDRDGHAPAPKEIEAAS